MAVFDDTAFDDHERVVFCHDAATGLKAIIAIHSTALGPAAGGCRLWAYDTDAAALHDVLRLSQGMSYKNAMAGLDFGGGKAVIIKGATFRSSDALFERFGDYVDQLGGSYITAEDVGMSVDIMEVISRRTRYVTGLRAKQGRVGGDPSPRTAFGVFKGISAAASFKLGSESLRGLRVAVQGVGNVGYNLCRYLADAGAALTVADIDSARLKRVVEEFGARAVPLDEILEQEADVLAPCALGAVLNARSIPKLKVPVVAGAANNQLETAEDGRRLTEAGILYAPDYVINSGGIINVALEYAGSGSDGDVLERIGLIGERLRRIFEEAAETGLPTNEVADRHARDVIAAAKAAHRRR